MGETIKDTKSGKSVLRWRFDINTFRLLGRELITDRITAVYELVKNCYDANATEVVVDFVNVGFKANDRKISISDNGIGMDFTDVDTKWMVVGTNSKRVSLYSPGPFNRRYVGEKGIGRFAVDKLGSQLLIKTKQQGADKRLIVHIDWDYYEQKSVESTDRQMSLFTEVDNEYHYEDATPTDHGTTLEITNVSETWSSHDLERLYKELSRLVSPFYPLNPPFNIYMNSNENGEYKMRLVKPDPVKFYSHHAEITFDLERQKQQFLRYDKESGKILTEWTEIKSFGPVKFKIFYFDEGAKKRYNTAYKNDDTRIDGVKIYRDGVITTPFAEYHSSQNHKRDILGIDKRRWRAAFDKPSTREIIGVLEIKQELNPKIVDATNRQDFIDNDEYRQLKEFILEQIDIFGDVKIHDRDLNRSVAEMELQKAGQEVKNFSNAIEKIERELIQDKPHLKEKLEPLKAQVQHLSSTITASIKEQKKFQKDVVRKENIYLSLMSLQDYAANISHAIRTSLGKIKRMAEFFKINFPNSKFDRLFIDYASLINEEMNTLIKVTDFMLSYASSDVQFEDFSIKEMLEELFFNAYSQTFRTENINVEFEFKDDFIINGNKKFLQDIFQNIISNSIKALKQRSNKQIKCSAFLDDNSFILFFSDNGPGIVKGDEKWIFGLYNTRTAEQGGSGIGLYIVEKRIEALKGTIEVVENEFKPTGATFKIKLPFNKN